MASTDAAAKGSGFATAIVTAGPSIVAPANASPVYFVTSTYTQRKCNEVMMLFVDSLRPFLLKTVSPAAATAADNKDDSKLTLKAQAERDIVAAAKAALTQADGTLEKGGVVIERREVVLDANATTGAPAVTYRSGTAEWSDAKVAQSLGGRTGVQTVLVAYTEDGGATVQTWHTALRGRVTSGGVPAGVSDEPWDRLWVVDAFPGVDAVAATTATTAVAAAPATPTGSSSDAKAPTTAAAASTTAPAKPAGAAAAATTTPAPLPPPTPTVANTKTLAEWGPHLALVNEPYLGLSDALRQHTFSGVMEIHIFVTPFNPTPEVQQKFRGDCAPFGIKCCHLRLDYVKHGFVSVLESSRYVNHPLHKVWREAFLDARRLAARGWDVIRTKIEATASIKGVPLTDAEARLLPGYTYFEFHMVFTTADGKTPSEPQMLEAGKAAQALEKQWGVCIPLSTNAFLTNKFLNMRCYGVGRNTAVPQLDALAASLVPHGFASPRQIREFGVYDSAVEVDCGWLEPEVLPPSHAPGFIAPIRPAILAASAAATEAPKVITAAA